jgi:ribonuclease HI
MLITLFSDASLCHQSRVGGWAAWLKSDRGAMRLGAPFAVKVSDTSLAEAMAVVNALSCGIRDGLILEQDVVLVQTDNNAVMTILDGTARRRATPTAKRRRKLSWSELRNDVRERNGEIEAIAAVYARLVASRALVIRWRHVKGHRGTIDARSAVNTYCDKVAKDHMRTARKRFVPTMAERAAARKGAAGDGVRMAA